MIAPTDETDSQIVQTQQGVFIQWIRRRPNQDVDIWMVIARAHVHDFVGLYLKKEKVFSNRMIPQFCL